jgi:hypothetical protein
MKTKCARKFTSFHGIIAERDALEKAEQEE